MASPGIGSRFCCAGCETVYGLLRERDLLDYYRLRDGEGKAPRAEPVVADTENYSFLDDPDFKNQYSDPRDGDRMQLYLEGAHCAACVWLTERLPEFVPGVSSVRLNLATSVATVQLGRGGSFAEAAREFARFGYRPHPVKQDEALAFRKKENRLHLIRLAVAAAASGNIMLLAIALYAGAGGQLAGIFRWVSFLLYLPVLFFSAVPFFQGAGAALRSRQISVDVPIAFGILMGTFVSIGNLLTGGEHLYFDSLASLVFLMLSTRYLLRKVNQRTFDAAHLMHFMAPSRSRRRIGLTGDYEEVRTDALKAGDRIRVLPGDCFPVDGVVIEGESSVSRALLTGEPEAIAVRQGSEVLAGTLNHQAPLEVKVMASGADTRLGSILREMEEGLSRKASIVTLLDRVGQAFLAAVLGLTVVGFFVGYLSEGMAEGIQRALAVSIIVCPCTFALATPLAFSLAIEKFARSGLLVKNAEVIERLSRIRSVFLDKTGTVTAGQLSVLSWESRLSESQAILLALESRSAHPIARAVVRHFASRVDGASLPEVRGLQEAPGKGISGRIMGSHFGSLFEIRRAEGAAPTGPESSGEPVRTRVGLYRDGEQVGVLTLGDRIRPDAAEAVHEMEKLGLQVSLLSGDSEAAVAQAARELGLGADRAISRVTPEEKARVVGSGATLMVGDGANDAIALASASVGVAVQGGMEVSMRAAGVYSSRPGLKPVLQLLRVSRGTLTVIYFNLAIAILFNVIGISFAMAGLLDPLVAAILMPINAFSIFMATIFGMRRLA